MEAEKRGLPGGNGRDLKSMTMEELTDLVK